MKTGLKLVVVALVSICGTVAVVDAKRDINAPAVGTKGVVVGEVIELTTYAIKGHGTEETAAAGASRAEQGFPVGILEEGTGAVYICAYRNPAPASGMQLANAMLAPLMGQKVVAQGLKYDRGSYKFLRMSIISEY